jgi:succinate dehydrogenase assembly factor 1
MARLSGLQREVLKLYRQCIRAAHTKPPQNKDHWLRYIRQEFSKYQNLPKKQFSVIEHLLRLGHKRYEMYNSPHIKDIH